MARNDLKKRAWRSGKGHGAKKKGHGAAPSLSGLGETLVIGKVMEKCILNNLGKYLYENRITCIYKNQYTRGF